MLPRLENRVLGWCALRMLMILLLCLAVGFPLEAQTRTQSELDTSYPANSYEVMPHIYMTPQYTDTDEVCEMTFQRRVLGKEEGIHDRYIPEEVGWFLIAIWGQEKEFLKPLNGPKRTVRVEGGKKITVYDYVRFEVSVTDRAVHPETGETLIVMKVKGKTCRAESPAAQSELRSPFQLLPGYKMKYGFGLEGQLGGTISKAGGPSIDFGLGTGYEVNTEEIPKDQVVWSEIQTIGARQFICVYTRDHRVVVSLVNGVQQGNFEAHVKNEQELAEVLMIIFSINSARGYRYDPATMQKAP
jgi:hypothetical protein